MKSARKAAGKWVPGEEHERITHREFVLQKTSVYAGSMSHEKRLTWALDLENRRMVKVKTRLPPSLSRLFLEIFSNAADACWKAKTQGIECGHIKVAVSGTTVSVENSGVRIAIEPHPKEKMWIPEMIFGVLLTSSNYKRDQVRFWAGTNGLGAKVTNILSSRFKVTIRDPETKQKYVQTWTDNMGAASRPKITSCPSCAVPSVRVDYDIDFPRFGYEAEGCYPDEAVNIFARHAADMAFMGGLRISFNGAELGFANIGAYARLYFPAKAVKKSIAVEAEGEDGARLEAMALDTPDKSEIVAFANGTTTTQGGVHVEAVIRELSRRVLDIIKARQGRANKSRSKASAGHERAAGAKRPEKFPLTLADVRPHVSLIVNYRCPDPEWESNAKECLTKPPPPKIKLAGADLSRLAKWQLVERLQAALLAKDFKRLAKTDGKKRHYIGPTHCEEANFAGTERSGECTLFIVEGKSAMSYPEHAMTKIAGGHDFIGVFPLRGKPLNAGKATMEEFLSSPVMAELKKVAGFEDGLGERGEGYVDDRNYSRLRYGLFYIMADADEDGMHIMGLLLEMLETHYRGLLMRGAVYFMRTPEIRVSRGKQKLSFYKEAQFRKWREETPGAHLWRVKYFKGLGSSNPEDVCEDFKDPHYVRCVYDKRATKALRLAFDDSQADKRKDWVLAWKPDEGDADLAEQKRQPISEFVNRELVLYAITTLGRAIPAMLDGLKDCQRKVIWAAALRWGSKGGCWGSRPCFSRSTFKVQDFVGKVSSKMLYRHAGASLVGAIVQMAQTFVGSQNMPHFVEDGMFGTRNQGGKDAAAPRYSFTYPEKWLPYVYRDEDAPLLQLKEEEGQLVEPFRMLPVIPMVLVNGAEGVAVGWSTWVPCHNPLDLVAWLRAKIRGDAELPPLVPWYHGFRGRISIEVGSDLQREKEAGSSDSAGEGSAGEGSAGEEAESESGGSKRRRKSRAAEGLATDVDTEASDSDSEAASEEAGSDAEGEGGATAEGSRRKALFCRRLRDGEVGMVTEGTFEVEAVEGKKYHQREEVSKVTVTELPLRKWTLDYWKWLQKLAADKQILDVYNHSGVNRVQLEIYGFQEPSVESLRLRRTFSMGNMWLLGADGIPKHYATTLEIIEDFYAARLPMYRKRKRAHVAALRERLDVIQSKVLFIEAVNRGEIVIRDRDSADVKAAMSRIGLPGQLFESVGLCSLSRDRLAALRKEKEELAEELGRYSKLSAGDLWQADLDDFEKAYGGWMEELEKKLQAREQRQKGKRAPRSRRRRKTAQ